MALDHDAPFRLVISEVRESAHSHSLRVGDEIVGLGSLSAPMTTFFEDDAKIELGDEGLVLFTQSPRVPSFEAKAR